jgi:GT2 family glycosyltransferase
MENSPTIAVLMACHNRRAKTIACLEQISGFSYPRLAVYLADDGSSDGTAEAARLVSGLDLTIIAGDGNWFWNGAMRKAFEACSPQRPDFALWVNDDVVFAADALRVHLDLAVRFPGAAIVGCTTAINGATITYGGLRRTSRWNPLALALIGVPGSESPSCDTCNGNSVMVPRSVYQRIPMFTPPFRHGMGDFDFGFRCRRQGIDLMQTPRAIGRCDRNAVRQTWEDPSVPLAQRWAKIRSPKGLPLWQWWVFCWRHGGWLFAAIWIAPYLRVFKPRRNSSAR